MCCRDFRSTPARATCSSTPGCARASKRASRVPDTQDTLGFKRVVETTGWQFNALILLVGDRVVYTLYGGQPNLHKQEVTRQPLGPVQNIGDAVSIGGIGR
jgi:hypothetical protein